MARYEIIASASVAEHLLECGQTTRRRFNHSVDLLESMPYLGREYTAGPNDPKPPVPCRCYPIPDTTKTFYYVVNDERRLVYIYALVDQRIDPSKRFRDIEPPFDS